MMLALAEQLSATRIRFGWGVAAEFGRWLDEHADGSEARRPGLLVTGSLTGKPWLPELIAAATRRGAIHHALTGSNSTMATIEAVVERGRAHAVERVIAIGGGSVIDTGKAAAAALVGSASLAELLASPATIERALPVLAVPTTSGTGAELTPFATVWDPSARRKLSLASPAIQPVAALVDPALVASLPRALTAGCGLDALAHAVEASWSVRAEPAIVGVGLEAAAALVHALPRVMLAPDDRELRSVIARASVLAGLAIAHTRTTLGHALSYPLTAWHGVHHGTACGLALGPVLRFNAAVETHDCADPRGVGYVRGVLDSIAQALGARSAPEAATRLRTLLEQLAVTRLCDREAIDLEAVAHEALAYDRSANNPRRASAGQLRALLADM